MINDRWISLTNNEWRRRDTEKADFFSLFKVENGLAENIDENIYKYPNQSTVKEKFVIEKKFVSSFFCLSKLTKNRLKDKRREEQIIVCPRDSEVEMKIYHREKSTPKTRIISIDH